jgi:sensor histidine kinase YesM
MRFEERLHVVMDIAPETRTFRVPPMLLQTLVENAVKYGIAEEEHGGTVSITAQVTAGRLHLRVTNPGTLEKRDQANGRSTGVGLRNAAERLRLLFGPQSALVIGTEGPHLVVAEAFVTRELAEERLT